MYYWNIESWVSKIMEILSRYEVHVNEGNNGSKVISIVKAPKA